MCFHCFGGKISNYLHFALFSLLFSSLSSLPTIPDALYICSLPEASGRRTANCLGTWTHKL